MRLDCTCCEITIEKWNKLMKGGSPIDYNWLISQIKSSIPSLYSALCLDFYNPYESSCRVTKTHYILVHSAIEYFILK